jgi:hypothetical protein
MTLVVLAQKCCSKRGGWPEPSKFTYFYENLLANCPYKHFFDTASLCHPANAAQVEALSRMEENEATSFFETTFRGRQSGRVCQRGAADVYKTFCKEKISKLTHS